MDTPKKHSVLSTYTTLKKCLEDNKWRTAYEIIKRSTKNMLKNHYYDE